MKFDFNLKLRFFSFLGSFKISFFSLHNPTLNLFLNITLNVNDRVDGVVFRWTKPATLLHT